MSWKGFQKGVSRAPHAFKAKFNMGEHTKDSVYIDAERRFQDLESQTKKLHDESSKYFHSINSMLSHQIEFSKAIEEIYKPISGRVSDPDSHIPEGNAEGIRACEEYQGIVRELQESLKPELEMIETRVIRPAVELMEIVKKIRKLATKRDHKQTDYDRHRETLKKLQEKKEKSLKDEKAMYKAENDVEQATQEFEYFNDLLKDELPQLFRLEREFIQPLFQSFYYMQLNVFYTLHERMQNIDIGYFDLTLDIEEAFHSKRGDAPDRAEALAMVHFKTTGGKKPVGNRYPRVGDKPSTLAIEDRKPGMAPTSPRASTSSSPPPPYTGHDALAPSTSTALVSTSPNGSSSLSAAAAGKAKPPPPKPKPSRLANAPMVETVTALYDYEAQAEGDLSFSAGETIEVVQRTANPNEWWTGRVNGKEGQFPGNYVQVN